MNTRAWPIAMVATGLLAGCASYPGHLTRSPRFQLSPDLYVQFVDRKGAVSDLPAMKADAVAAATAFAQARGKTALPVTLYGAPVAFAGFTTVSYQFRLVDPGTPTASFR